MSFMRELEITIIHNISNHRYIFFFENHQNSIVQSPYKWF